MIVLNHQLVIFSQFINMNTLQRATDSDSIEVRFALTNYYSA